MRGDEDENESKKDEYSARKGDLEMNGEHDPREEPAPNVTPQRPESVADETQNSSSLTFLKGEGNDSTSFPGSETINGETSVTESDVKEEDTPEEDDLPPIHPPTVSAIAPSTGDLQEYQHVAPNIVIFDEDPERFVVDREKLPVRATRGRKVSDISTVSVKAKGLGKSSNHIKCWKCNKKVRTTTKLALSPVGLCSSVAVCVLCPLFAICVIPFIMKRYNVVVHVCPRCKQRLGSSL